MRKAMMLAVGVAVCTWLAGSAVAVDFFPASDTAQSGFERHTYGNNQTIFVAPEAVFSSDDDRTGEDSVSAATGVFSAGGARMCQTPASTAQWIVGQSVGV